MFITDTVETQCALYCSHVFVCCTWHGLVRNLSSRVFVCSAWHGPSAQSQAYVFNLKETPLYVCSRAHYKGDMELAKLSPMFSPSGFYI